MLGYLEACIHKIEKPLTSLTKYKKTWITNSEVEEVITSNSRKIKLLKDNKNYEHLLANKFDASNKIMFLKYIIPINILNIEKLNITLLMIMLLGWSILKKIQIKTTATWTTKVKKVCQRGGEFTFSNTANWMKRVQSIWHTFAHFL